MGEGMSQHEEKARKFSPKKVFNCVILLSAHKNEHASGII